MGQGQDKIAKNLVDLQPTAIVELFLLFFDQNDNNNAFIAFHGGSIFNKGITWQGVEYLPIPVETDSFEISANSELQRPKIKISNKDYFMTDLLNKYQDLQFAKIIRKRTFVKFLDDVNFDGGNPWGEADFNAEIGADTFFISQKTSENKLYVELELTSPLDLENYEVNNRLILARYCSWSYRGGGCNYEGPPIETEQGESIKINEKSISDWAFIYENREWQSNQYYLSGDPAYMLNTKNTSLLASKIWYVCKEDHLSTNLLRPDLSATYWVKDGCAKKLANCRKRFANDENIYLSETPSSITNNYFSLEYRNYTGKQRPIVTLQEDTFLSYNNLINQPHLAQAGKSFHLATWFKLSDNIDVATRAIISDALLGPYYEYIFSMGTVPNYSYEQTTDTSIIFAMDDDYEPRLEFTFQVPVFIYKGGGLSNPTFTTGMEDVFLEIRDFYSYKQLNAIHLEVWGGRANKINPTLDESEGGYIKFSTNNNQSPVYYELPQKRQLSINGVRPGEYQALNNKTPNSGSFFKFRNSAYTGNNHFRFLCREVNGNVPQGNIGATAIWTGDSEVPDGRKLAFTRNDPASKLNNASIANKIPIKYSELPLMFKKDLSVWWEMDLSNEVPYQILNSHDGSRILNLSGAYDSRMEKSETLDTTQLKTIAQTASLSLPFGGFPGTDNYAR